MKIKFFLLTALVVFGITSSAQTCSLSLTTQSTNSSCQNSQNGSASVIPGLGTAPYSFLWSANAGFQTNATATGLSIGTYTVVVTDSTGCVDSASVAVVAAPLITPDICMISVDDSSVYNVIYYEKTNYFNVDSFIFYRETAPSVYTRIGARPYDSLSRFFDTVRSIGPVIGDPNLNSNRYKIQIRDSCGNYSSLSSYHQSLFIVHLGNGNFQWSVPYEIEGLSNPVNNYALLCDTANTGGWGPVSTVSGSTNNASDPGYANHSAIANWRVVTAWNIVCNPSLRQSNQENSMMAVVKSRSNVINNRTSGLNNFDIDQFIRVYPNPTNENIFIDLASTKLSYHGNNNLSASVLLRTATGQLLSETKQIENTTIIPVQTTGLKSGVYFLELIISDYRIVKKIIINTSN